MNYWILEAETLGEYPTNLTPVDGDLSKVTMIDKSVDIGYKAIRKMYSMTSGREVHTDFLPTQVSSDGPLENVGDLAIVYHEFTVSDRLKDMIEAVAPGNVQFAPFDVVDGASGKVQAQRHWFNPTVRLFAMDKEKTTPGFMENGFYEFGGPMKEQKIFFDATVTAGKPIFATAEYPGRIFVSDAFVDAVADGGFTGLQFRWKFPAE